MSQQIVVKGYQIEKKVDQTGLKTYYRAVKISNGEKVFLIMVPIRPGPYLEAYTRRASLSKKLRHSQLTTPLDYGIIGNEYFYYTIPAVPSLKLSDLLERQTHSQNYWFHFTSYFLQLLEIIRYVHSARVTHRDITTANIRVTRNQKVILEGFVNPRLRIEQRNIANIVNLPYISPEQLCGAPADMKTDIYSLGVVFYELITDMLPYPSNYVKIDETAKGTLPRISEQREGVPEELELMALKALAPRELRYSSVEEWIADLEAYYRQRPIRLKIKDFSTSLKQLFSFKT